MLTNEERQLKYELEYNRGSSFDKINSEHPPKLILEGNRMVWNYWHESPFSNKGEYIRSIKEPIEYYQGLTQDELEGYFPSLPMEQQKRPQFTSPQQQPVPKDLSDIITTDSSKKISKLEDRISELERTAKNQDKINYTFRFMVSSVENKQEPLEGKVKRLESIIKSQDEMINYLLVKNETIDPLITRMIRAEKRLSELSDEKMPPLEDDDIELPIQQNLSLLHESLHDIVSSGLQRMDMRKYKTVEEYHHDSHQQQQRPSKVMIKAKPPLLSEGENAVKYHENKVEGNPEKDFLYYRVNEFYKYSKRNPKTFYSHNDDELRQFYGRMYPLHGLSKEQREKVLKKREESISLQQHPTPIPGYVQNALREQDTMRIQMKDW